ncbi:hypothetical protein [Brevibacillus migulae]|uniref:hypothetical protein n=1 Tax=Brevibacillus migulae TaxID=1644114 RepID=UPI00106E178E|nr:hypothetical protein [Brevibacillus migulae]
MNKSNQNYNINLAELEGLLELASDKVPQLISGIMKSFYTEEAGSQIGKAVGVLYKELIAAGMPQETAVKMATDYMVSLKDVLKTADMQDNHK